MRILASATLLLAVLLLAGCASKPVDHSTMSMSSSMTGTMAMHKPETIEIMAMNVAFTPKQATAHVGDTIHWVDHDNANPHNVVSQSEGNEFTSPDMDGALPTYVKEYSYTVKAAGTIDYVCTYHSGMTGTITVEA